MPNEKTMSSHRAVVSMPPKLRAEIKRFRFDRLINTEAEAIRRLIERGLEAEGAR